MLVEEYFRKKICTRHFFPVVASTFAKMALARFRADTRTDAASASARHMKEGKDKSGEDMRCILCLGARTTSRHVLDSDECAAKWINTYQIDIGNELKGVSKIIARRCLSCGLTFYDPGLCGGPQLYRELQKHAFYYMYEKWEHKTAVQYVHENNSVLEIGCGDGAFLDRITGIQGVECTGLEMNPDAVETATAKGLNVMETDVSSFAASNIGRFDVVCHFQVLEHVPDPRAFLADCVKLLRPEGLMMFAVPKGDGFLKHATYDLLNMPPHHISVFGKRTMRAIPELFGLEFVKLWHEPLADYHVKWFCDVQIDRIPRIRYLTWPIIGMLRKWMPGMIRTLKLSHVLHGHSVLAVYRKPSARKSSTINAASPDPDGK